MITSDLAQNNQRKQNLEEYLTEKVLNVLEEEPFKCAHSHDCKRFHSGDFYEGQLHHVGRYYHLAINDKPFRIVVVGLSYGHPPARVTMEERYRMVVVKTGENMRFRSRNPHMRGTTSLLLLLLGIPLGTDHASEYIQINDGDKCHIFDAFALVNYLLCSAVSKAGDRRDKSAETMRQNCRKHFREALLRLEPTVVIVQGKKFWPDIKKSFDSVAALDKDYPSLYKTQLGEREFLTAAFSHPSTPDSQHGWGITDHDRYLLETVKPTVEKIREEILGSTQ